jgi:hypothetical protein
MEHRFPAYSQPTVLNRTDAVRRAPILHREHPGSSYSRTRGRMIKKRAAILASGT